MSSHTFHVSSQMQRPSLLLVLVAVIVTSSSNDSCCNSFSVPQSYHARSSHASSSILTQLSSTTTTDATASIQQSSTLKPPMSIDELMDVHNNNQVSGLTEAQELYNNVVQTTYGRYPMTIKSGKGCYLTTIDDKEYIDCVAGIATCALGHSNSYLTNAITRQMELVHHVSNLYYIPTQAALALWLTQNSVAEKVFFCNSGAEANEAAIKCARRAAYNRNITQPIIITAEQSFHGRTLGALSATGQPKYHKGFTYDGQMMAGFKFIPYNNVAALKEAVQEIEQNPQQGLAGIMMEALQGEGGIMPGQEDFFQTIRQICDEKSAFMICDEVQIGMGRSGKLWGYENLNVEPDIFTSAKALGGGVPIGAMMARGIAATTFGPGDHASTFGGNPLACAAGLAVAQYFYDHNILNNVQERHVQLKNGLTTLANTKYTKLLGTVRGWGLLMGVEVIHDAITPAMIIKEAMNVGLLLVGAGSNVIRFVPPLIISATELDEVITKFDLAIANVLKQQEK